MWRECVQTGKMACIVPQKVLDVYPIALAVAALLPAGMRQFLWRHGGVGARKRIRYRAEVSASA